MNPIMAVVTVAVVLGASSLAAAQQTPQELSAETAAERAQQGTKAYNPAVPQGCDAVTEGYCIQITKERDVEVPPDNSVRPKQR